MDSYCVLLKDFTIISPGTIIKRQNNKLNKLQQGVFIAYDDGVVVKNVIDLKNNSFIAAEGIIYPDKDDILYYYVTSFATSPKASKAMKIIYEWPLYQKHQELSLHIEQFVKTAFVPEQILEFQKNDTLQTLFVPIQQYFRIGRYK